MKKLLFLSLFMFSIFSFSQQKEILKNLSDSQTAWNNGDLEKFMEGYWKDDRLVFIGKSGKTYGWQKTLDNYKKSYPNKEKMGTLSFGDIEVQVINKEFAFVTGLWKLTRISDELKGYYSLLFRKIKGKWLIVADHSS
ncbi:MAG: nuclear transport factor 2 family protein [Cloacibacterium sp.]|nr:nuclear transport factor 2 family protein [Cloacibacterium sp.]